MGRILKVVIVAPGNHSGGEATQAAFLVRHWTGHPDVRVELALSDPHFPRVLRALEQVPYLRTFIRFFVYIPNLWGMFKHADVVHIFSAAYWSCLLVSVPALLVARINKSKTILHYHSGKAADHLQHWRSLQWLLRRVDCIVVPSRYLAQVFAAHNFVTKIVPNGVDEAQFSFRERTVVKPYLLCSRNFEPHYRVDLVIRAFAAIKKQIPEAVLTLVGSGSCENELRGLVKGLAVQDVVFAGDVENFKIAEYYDRADLWLNASVVDNLPVSILEAFSSGCVVISSAAGGIPYIVEHGISGLLSPPEDVDAMVANILLVLDTPALALRLTGAAYNQSQQYRWSGLCPIWTDLYRRLAVGVDIVGDARISTVHKKCSGVSSLE